MPPPVIFDISDDGIKSFFRGHKFDLSIASSVAQRGYPADTLLDMKVTATDVYDTAKYQLTRPELLEWHPYFMELVENVEPPMF